MITDFKNRILAAIDREIGDVSARIGNGGASDWSDYKRLTGYVAGLKTARVAIEETYASYLRDEE